MQVKFNHGQNTWQVINIIAQKNINLRKPKGWLPIVTDKNYKKVESRTHKKKNGLNKSGDYAKLK